MTHREFFYFDEEDTEPLFFRSVTGEELKCETCGDISLYHDSHAWAHGTTHELLCEGCFAKLEEPKKEGFRHVITYH